MASARVIVVAGPSGSGKSRLARRLGLPVLNLDDFYRSGSDPDLPCVDLPGGETIVDWDDPASWHQQDAVATIEQLCRTGSVDVPIYDIARNGRVGHRLLDLGSATHFVAEGIFAQEVVADCGAQGLLEDAVCVRQHPLVTFWRRLTRDLRERRKSPHVLVRRGWMLMRQQPQVVANAVAKGCTPVTPDEAYARLGRLRTP